MDSTVRPSVPDECSVSSPLHVDEAQQRLTTLSSLLSNLEEPKPARAMAKAAVESPPENRLLQVRLGMASSLFAALRAKHAPTADHSLRVALGCSSWALALDIPDQQRDEIEVASLLHDVGKVGVPDDILRKPGVLTSDEFARVERHRHSGLEILSLCSASDALLDIVHYAAAWFSGGKPGFDLLGDELPLGARMLAIVDAFDAMTTDQVYRRAISRERAVAELFEFAGEQFDPQLVKSFCHFLERDRVKLNVSVARRWLRDLHPDKSNGLWKLGQYKTTECEMPLDMLFQRRLLENLNDGVVFVDASLRILTWNHALERLTSLPASSVAHKRWSPSLIQMRDDHGEDISEAECPLAAAIQSRTQALRRLSIAGRNGRRVSVDAHLFPVTGAGGVIQGAGLVLHDASSRITLEERVESLHVRATQDPLTKLANRAEFDRVHKQFVETHLEQSLPCSMIICDLDFFKKINDNYGHQAGDEALVGFAALLRRFHRPGDLVARYGGEEFVMLCADCDNATATSRAEELRRELAATPQAMLSGKCITASFGVTEIQDGDSPETMLRRADRALLQAKELGRNTVVQLGTGMRTEPVRQCRRGWLTWLTGGPPDQLLEQPLITAVPLKVAVEKLRGFVADHHADIRSIDEDRVIMKIDGQQVNMLRRRHDRTVPFIVDLQFEEIRLPTEGRSSAETLRTLIHVAVRPIRNRDRRRRDVLERARHVLTSLKSYLMASDFAGQAGIQGDEGGGLLAKAKSLFAPLTTSRFDDSR